MKGSLHNIVFAAVLGTVCSLLLTGAAQFTAADIARNREAERIRNILLVFEVPLNGKKATRKTLLEVSYEQLKTIYKDNIVPPGETDAPALYKYVPVGGDGAVQAVAVHFAGKGLWGPIRGFLALNLELTTIRGVTFYEQEETPGLGGDIDTKEFTERFKGKQVRDVAGRAGIRIVRSGATGPNEIDGLSGATLTCRKVEAMLNRAIERILKERANGG